MHIYLAGDSYKKECVDEYLKKRSYNMNLYLAGQNGREFCVDNYIKSTTNRSTNEVIKRKEKIDINLLESFYYAKEWTEKIIPHLNNFLLDSGAFTFMSNAKKGNINWKEYIDKYIAFINRNNVKHFFELDIDVIVGYENVKKIRKYIEEKTNKKSIPVWHKSRGKEEYLKMCDEYDYVAIGGIVSKEITQKEYKYFTWFINEAHKRGAKVHGLGFTNLKGIEKYKFDSVDSTSWTTGNRFGAIYKFNGKTMIKYDKQEGQRLADPKSVAIHNFNEWVKFQKYAEKHL